MRADDLIMPDHDLSLKVTIISCSIAAESRSRTLAHEADRLLQSHGHTPKFIDLRDLSIPEFDNDRCYLEPAYVELHRTIREGDGVILATPIYNWSIGSMAKRLVELTGATGVDGLTSAWFDQIVTFLCAGGLPHSYMAYGSLAMSLMLDFKCIINPYVVYASTRELDDHGVMSESLSARLRKTLDVKVQLASLLKGRRYTSVWEI